MYQVQSVHVKVAQAAAEFLARADVQVVNSEAWSYFSV